MFSKWKKNIFLHFILSYIVVLLILTTVMLVVSIQNLVQRQQEAFALSEEAVEQSINSIEDRFTEFSNLVQNISISENLRDIQHNDNTGFYPSYKLIQELKTQCVLNSFVDAIYVMLPVEDKIIGSDGIVSNTEFFHRIRYDAEQGTYQNWLEGIKAAQRRSGTVSLEKVRIGSDEQNVILYSQPLITNMSNSKEEGTVFIYVSEDRLGSLVVNSGEMIQFSMGISRQEGEEIQLITPPGDITGKTFSISRTSSSGKSYECLFLENVILQGWYKQFLLNSLLIFLSLFIAIGLCIFFARRNSRPIADVVTILSDTPENIFTGETGVYTFIQKRVAELLDDRNALNLELERRIPLMQVGFIERLLSGTATDYTDLEGQLADLRLQLNGDCYCVAVLQVANFGMMENDREGISVVQMILENLIRRYAGENSIIYANEETRITAIFGLESFEQEERIVQICRSIIEQMKCQNVQIQIAIGAPYTSLADTFIAFAQAKRLLDHVSMDEAETLITYNSYHSKADFYYFPTEIEVKLIRVMMSGNQAAVSGVFEELKRENIEKVRLVPAMMQGLIEELNGTYMKVLSALSDSGVAAESLEPFYLYENLEEASFFSVYDRFKALCEFIAGLRDEKSGKLREHICEYLDRNFTDSNMNLAMLSEEFGVSESYMSRLFKEQMATTFSQYLEKIRMNYALELLKNEKKPINQVAEDCGYSSPHAFRRAFKRYWGYLPSQGRD